jgi:S-adenosylmethionine decarboxylase
MRGLHLMADLYDCRCDLSHFTDVQDLRKLCLQAVDAVGLKAVDHLFYTFPAITSTVAHGLDAPNSQGGVTATVLLAESHLCIHTWPECRSVTLDVYVCNVCSDHSAAAHTLMSRLTAYFRPQQTQLHALERGTPLTAIRTMP